MTNNPIRFVAQNLGYDQVLVPDIAWYRREGRPNVLVAVRYKEPTNESIANYVQDRAAWLKGADYAPSHINRHHLILECLGLLDTNTFMRLAAGTNTARNELVRCIEHDDRKPDVHYLIMAGARFQMIH